MEEKLTKATILEIHKHHNNVCRAMQTVVEEAIRAGEGLVKIKANLKHGQWTPWIKTNLRFGDDTAQAYMRCFRSRDKLEAAKTEHGRDLSIKGFLTYCSQPTPEEVDEQKQQDKYYVEETKRLALKKEKISKQQEKIIQEHIAFLEEKSKEVLPNFKELVNPGVDYSQIPDSRTNAVLLRQISKEAEQRFQGDVEKEQQALQELKAKDELYRSLDDPKSKMNMDLYEGAKECWEDFAQHLSSDPVRKQFAKILVQYLMAIYPSLQDEAI